MRDERSVCLENIPVSPSLTIHLIPSAVSALRFVEPIVSALRDAGFRAELWTEATPGAQEFISSIRTPIRLLRFNLVANPIVVIFRLIALWSAFRKIRPTCVHAHQTRGALIPLLAAWFAGVPHRIYHNHGSAYWGTQGVVKRLFGVLEKLTCTLATYVLFVNPRLREIFVQDSLVSAEKSQAPEPGSACGIDLDRKSVV